MESKNFVIEGEEDISVAVYGNIRPIAELWDAHCGDNIFVNSSYLSLVEDAGPIAYRFFYVFIKKQDAVIGLVYCQNKTIDLNKDFRLHSHGGLWEDIKVKLSKLLFRFVKHEILICGNVILTGEYGIRLEAAYQSKVPMIIPKVLEAVKKFAEEQHQIKIQSTLLKDFYKKGPLQKIAFDADSYTRFEVQPDMVVNIKSQWESYADYLKDVKSKYRVKFKKVKKRGAQLIFKELSEEEAIKYNDAMYRMYKDTSDRATFSLFLLGPTYFSDLKVLLKNELRLTGVFLEGELVAFFTYIRNGEMGDAHFLGYNVGLNAKHQIYFNILLNLLETAIIDKATYLNLSRTALEIKSSVGAVPHGMDVHLMHHNSVINKWLPGILDRFVPKNDWVARSPFK